MTEYCSIHPAIAKTCPRCVAVARGKLAGASRSVAKLAAAKENIKIAQAARRKQQD